MVAVRSHFIFDWEVQYCFVMVSYSSEEFDINSFWVVSKKTRPFLNSPTIIAAQIRVSYTWVIQYFTRVMIANPRFIIISNGLPLHRANDTKPIPFMISCMNGGCLQCQFYLPITSGNQKSHAACTLQFCDQLAATVSMICLLPLKRLWLSSDCCYIKFPINFKEIGDNFTAGFATAFPFDWNLLGPWIGLQYIDRYKRLRMTQ